MGPSTCVPTSSSVSQPKGILWVLLYPLLVATHRLPVNIILSIKCSLFKLLVWILFLFWILSNIVALWVKTWNTYIQTHVPSLISAIFCHSKMKNVNKKSFLWTYYCTDQNPRNRIYCRMEPKRSPKPLFSSWSILVTERLSDLIYRVAEWMWGDPWDLMEGGSSVKCPQPPVRMLPWSLTRWLTDFFMRTRGRKKFLSSLSAGNNYAPSEDCCAFSSWTMWIT